MAMQMRAASKANGLHASHSKREKRETRRRASRSPPRRVAAGRDSQDEFFMTPIPVATVATVATVSTPVYLPTTQTLKAETDYFELAVVGTVAIVFFGCLAFALSSALAEPPEPEWIPIQQRGPLSWAMLLFKSMNEW